jgi:hypothetical protein
MNVYAITMYANQRGECTSRKTKVKKFQVFTFKGATTGKKLGDR